MENVTSKAMAGGLIGLVAWRALSEARKQKVLGFLGRVAAGVMEAVEKSRQAELAREATERQIESADGISRPGWHRRVTYLDSCQLALAQRVTEAPRELLRAIPGLEFREMDNSNRCCGAGSTYTVTQRELSMRLLTNQMRVIEDTGAEVVTTANPG